MKPGRVAMLVVGCLLVLPGVGLLLGGGALGLGYAVGRDDDGFFAASLDRFESSTVAVTAEQIDFGAEPGSPDWIIDALDADVRLSVTSASTDRAVFVGIAPQADVDAYLDGVAHDEVRELTDGRRPVYRNRSGGDDVEPPTEQSFWTASASGPGTQELVWEATGGRWAAVIMNADGRPGVVADVDVGVKTGIVLPLAALLAGVGVVLTVVAVLLIVFGALGLRREGQEAGSVAEGVPGAVRGRTPVALEARLDPDLSSWKWLVKWFLAIPHFVVLFFLYLAFVVLTVVAGFSILFTGTYPRRLFDFNVGVLRWTWRVTYYATAGGIGTDRYPPFSLYPEPDDHATLDIAYPATLSRGLVLVKWWLLAIPHYVIVGTLIGGTVGWRQAGDDAARFDSPGLLTVLTLVAGVILLFRKRYPRSLFDLIIGCNRWIYRVVAYAALMTDEYPPFRLDQGGSEPAEPVAADTGGAERADESAARAESGPGTTPTG